MKGSFSIKHSREFFFKKLVIMFYVMLVLISHILVNWELSNNGRTIEFEIYIRELIFA